MSLNCGIYCLHNAARSPLLEALLQKLYPEYSFFSGGVVAQEDRELPKNSKKYAKLLGLEDVKAKSENVIAHTENLEMVGSIIAAEDVIADVFQRLYPEKRIYSVEKYARHSGLRVIDPIDIDGFEFDYQVGKFLYCGNSLFRKEIALTRKSAVTAIVAKQANIRSEVERFFLLQTVGDVRPLIVDCDFKFAAQSNDLGFISQDHQKRVDGRDLITLSHEELDGVWSTRQPHEMTAWEKFAVSKEWGEWLREISLHRPVILLCTPVDIVEGKKHNSFIEAMMADDLIYAAAK
jgi:protein-tyrosine-phosphatase